MILFIGDWENHPHAIVDLSTTNQSFIDFAGVLKSMGVLNHAFPLALHNPALVGINPHSTDLTKLERRAIIKEAFENPWYYFRECLLAPAKSGIGGNPFRANRGNIATIWTFFNHIMQLLIQPRQTGKSFTVEGLMGGLLNVWAMNTSINLLTKDDTLRSETVSRIKDIMDYLPPYLINRRKSDSNNSETITVNLNNNVYKTHVAQSSRKNALKAARGLTSPIMHIDEFAYCDNIHITLPSALPATGAAMDEAREKGAPHGVIFTTTAGWLDSKSGQYAYKFYMNAMSWTETLYDTKNEKALRRILRANGNDDSATIVIDMNHRQLGFTDEWLKIKLQDAQSTGSTAETDYLNIWADGSATSPFDKQLLKRMRGTIIESPTVEISTYGYALRWYKDRDTLIHEEMVMGLDTSEALGKDDIGLVIRLVSTGEVVAVGDYNETNIMAFGTWLSDLLVEYPKMVLMIEKRSTGSSIIDMLSLILSGMGINPFYRIFNWVVQESMVKSERYVAMTRLGLDETFQSRHKAEMGYATAASGRATRDKLYGNALMQSMEFTHTKVFDKKLVTQINSLMIRNNRIDHTTDGKDDLVVAWLLGYWFLSNVHKPEAYGISSKNLLCNVKVHSEVDKLSDMEQMKQATTSKLVSTLLKRLEHTEDPQLTEILITRITRLKDSMGNELTDIKLNIANAVKEIIKSRDREQSNKHAYHIH